MRKAEYMIWRRNCRRTGWPPQYWPLPESHPTGWFLRDYWHNQIGLYTELGHRAFVALESEDMLGPQLRTEEPSPLDPQSV